MEGGIGILLLLILAVVAIGFAIAMYVTGGALLKSEDKAGGDDGHRPEHKRPTSPTQEKVHMVGTRDDGESDR